MGIVVDDAIMVLENIVRHREQGSGQVEAASNGAREITFAAFAASLALIAIFLPVALKVAAGVALWLHQGPLTFSRAAARTKGLS